MTPEESGPQVLFIGGTGRCGTSITRVALGGHPRAATLPFEHRFLIDPDGVLDFWRTYSASWSPFLADQKLRRFERTLKRLAGQSGWSRSLGNLIKRTGLSRRGLLTPRQYQGWALGEAIPGFANRVDELLSELTSFSYRASWVGSPSYRVRPTLRHAPPLSHDQLRAPLQRFTAATVQGLLTHQNKSVYVEDNTWNHLFYPELAELLPNSKLLHVYRDPRDVVTSLLTQRWAPADLNQLCDWYRDVVTRWFVVREELARTQYREIAWEDLVNDPRRTLEQACDFGGLEFDPAVLATSLSAKSSGRWKRDLSTEQQAVVNDRLSDLIEQLGYPR